MVFSADSRLVAIGSGTKAIKVYDTATGEVAHALALDNSSSALTSSLTSSTGDARLEVVAQRRGGADQVEGELGVAGGVAVAD